ncbi:carbohydrate ABC transporter substrate-binding protein [Paenibacillus donghaensis]|uniref:ABC transporter substrate-binding protein n=1 Tax=Paenibacillus donghaensis TaxID=414771 RepID=UPI001883CE5D|nr:ABC transporter substrate-binding protein [Paenibacillus donghaensis]MBE9914553.1 carbohydrate ABC transporter substrate-binding protein [Paenibacillus donghaensis]
MKKKILGLVALVLAFSVLAACGSKKESATTADGVTTIEFWAAANPTQQAFWEKMAKAYEQTNSKVKINVSVIKESPSSEASIQAAIAGGSAPTISENINRGFAAQLANSKALVPLDTLDGFNDIVTTRNMKNTIEPWKFADDHQYVLPIYSNAMLFGWRLDLLKELGYAEPPKTYSEALEANKKLKEKYPDKYFWAKADLADPTAWKRWFDFFMLYDAASGGNKFIEGNKFVGDEKAGVETLKFVDDLRKDKGILAQNVADPFETGTSLFIDLGPWTFTNWAEKFPDMKYNQNYTLSMPPVPDGIDPKESKTFADTKGLVIYASATKEQQQAAMDFIKWVYADAKNDAQWFDETKLPPARDDLTTNESFKAILDKNPELKPYAENVPNAIPPMDNPKYNDLQTFIGQEAWNKVVRGEIDPATGWANMKKAIEGELQ